MFKPRTLRNRPGDVLRLVNNESIIGLTLNDVLIASNHPNDIQNMARIFAFIEAEERPIARVAHLGGGLGLFPKMLMGFGYEQDIYELDADIIDFLREGSLGGKARFILGDWHQTISGQYDFIIYDTGESWSDRNRALIEEHLNKRNGKFYIN